MRFFLGWGSGYCSETESSTEVSGSGGGAAGGASGVASKSSERRRGGTGAIVSSGADRDARAAAANGSSGSGSGAGSIASTLRRGREGSTGIGALAAGIAEDDSDGGRWGAAAGARGRARAGGTGCAIGSASGALAPSPSAESGVACWCDSRSAGGAADRAAGACARRGAAGSATRAGVTGCAWTREVASPAEIVLRGPGGIGGIAGPGAASVTAAVAPVMRGRSAGGAPPRRPPSVSAFAWGELMWMTFPQRQRIL
jgi:hypothetical protein